MGRATISIASRGSLLAETHFSNYDACLNTYVGCEFACTYCYVRYFIKDDKLSWGQFVRVRAHLQDRLPRELQKGHIKLKDGWRIVNDKRQRKFKHLAIPDARLVIGTMTDPYQPAERKHRITRTALDTLLRQDLPHFKKVGIFTRSPIVLDDLRLITQLPKPRVHFTITPFPPAVMRAIEPYSPMTSRRWDVVKWLKAAGLRVHCNISPVIPQLSERFIPEFVQKLIALGVDEYFVDPMQPYAESFQAFAKACYGLPGVNWTQIEQTITDRNAYLDWKADFFGTWNEEREKHQHLAPNQLPIWCDHENGVWINMLNMKQMNHCHYGDET